MCTEQKEFKILYASVMEESLYIQWNTESETL